MLLLAVTRDAYYRQHLLVSMSRSPRAWENMARTLSVAKPPPPIFLAPLLAHQTPKCIRSIAPFSTSTPFLQRRRRKRDNNMDRGVSALRRTGLRYPVEMSKVPLPQPVLEPKKRSEISVDENHGLWGFFRADKKLLSTPEELTEFGMSHPHPFLPLKRSTTRKLSHPFFFSHNRPPLDS